MKTKAPKKTHTMKKINFMVVLATALFATMAKGQFNLGYKPINGQGKILLTSKISGMKPTSKGVRTVEISNNSSMSPIVDGKEDSVFSSGPMSFSDTFPVSLTFPKYYYVREGVVTKDTSGVSDTANATSFLPVLVTPTFKEPTQTLFKLIVSQTTATVSGNFTSGFDSFAIVEVIPSYGDSLFLNPSYKYSFKQKAYVKAGANQNNSLSFTIPINAPGEPFSYRVKVSNNVGDTLSPIFSGRTLSDTAAAMVSSPYNLQSWSDSVSFMDETIATGIVTKHTSYIAKSLTGKPFDSLTRMIPAGQPDGIILRNSFRGLSPLTDYYVWSTVKNSLNSLPFASNRVLIQTGKVAITKFKLVIDSTASVSMTDEAIYFTAEIPDGESANVVILGRTWPGGITKVLGQMTLPSGYQNKVINYPSCVFKQKYQVTIYGSDDRHTKDYDAWEVTDTFTFYPNYTASMVKIQKEKIGVYPNPPTGGIIHATEPIEIYGKGGEKVAEGTDLDLSDLSPGLYYYRSMGNNTIRGKIQIK